MAGLAALGTGCGNGASAHSAAVTSPASSPGISCAGGCSAPTSPAAPQEPPKGPAVTVTSSDGYRYRISAGAPKLVTQVNDPHGGSPGTAVPTPANNLYYIAIPVTVTNLQTDRSTPVLYDMGNGGSGPPEIDFDVAVPASVEAAFGAQTDGPVGQGTSASGCLNQTGNAILPTTTCELAALGEGLFAVDPNGQDLVNDQITLPPGGSDDFTLYVTPGAPFTGTDSNGVTVATNGYPSNAPLHDLQLYYQSGYDTQASLTQVPLG